MEERVREGESAEDSIITTTIRDEGRKSLFGSIREYTYFLYSSMNLTSGYNI